LKITNKKNLPSAFVNIANEQREYHDKHYSVTEILSGVREILLKRRHYDELEEDVSDMIWAIWGTAVHKMLEEHDTENVVELEMFHEIRDDYYLTGKCDLYNQDEFSIEDYKTASVWKVVHEDFEDWRKQGLMYAWLAIRQGLIVDKIKFYALLKDWSVSKAKYSKDYPQQAIYTYEVKVDSASLKEIEQFIRTKFDDIIVNEDTIDSELPICTKKERWTTPTVWAVMKKGRKSAVKLYNNKEDLPEEILEPYYIEVRKGEDKKCDNYCLVANECSYYRGGK
jgi:hypothetical protein